MTKQIFLLGAASLAVAAPASAAITIATYTGHFTGGAETSIDVTGLFGAPFTPLGGTAYKAVFRIDDTLPGAPVYVPISQYTDGTKIQGGSDYGTNVLPVSGTITINGRTQSFLGNAASVAIQIHHNYDSTIHYVSGRRGSLFAHIVEFEPIEFLTTPDLRAPLEYDLPAGDPNSGIYFSIYQNDATTYDYAFGAATIDHISITAGSAVPEPAAWSLMIAGFGLVGVALRRRAMINQGAC